MDDGKTNYGGFMQMIQENNQVTIKFSAALGDELIKRVTDEIELKEKTSQAQSRAIEKLLKHNRKRSFYVDEAIDLSALANEVNAVEL